jgi:hypothetical protein
MVPKRCDRHQFTLCSHNACGQRYTCFESRHFILSEFCVRVEEMLFGVSGIVSSAAVIVSYLKGQTPWFPLEHMPLENWR